MKFIFSKWLRFTVDRPKELSPFSTPNSGDQVLESNNIVENQGETEFILSHTGRRGGSSFYHNNCILLTHNSN